MEEGSDGSSSVLSSPSSISATSAVSFKKQPLHLYGEYKPLSGVYNKHHQPLPLALTGIKDSNSEGFISALKSLQSKIHQLEVDRTLAAGKLKKLSDETRHEVLSSGNRHNQRERGRSNEDGRASRETASPERQPSRDFSHRLDSLDTRYSLQLQEIELMKDRLKRATGDQDGREKENQETIDLSTLPPPPPLSDVSPLKETEERLQILEDKQAKLQAEQVFASSKLNNLEGRLLQKQWQKRQVQKTTSSHLQYFEDDDDRDRRDGGRRKKKTPVTSTCSHRRKPPAAATESVAVSKPIPGVHYHLRMKDVPFVVGTSTGPSHSVTANYQKVVSLMKSHNPLLCGAVAANSIPNPPPKRKTSPRGSKKKKKSCSFSTGPSCEELEGLLVALEAEFGRLTFEHSELATLLQQQQQKQETSPSRPSSSSPSSRRDPVTGDIESELSQIVEQLEGKMEQIQIVKKLLASERKQRQVDTSNPKSHKKGYTDSHYHDDDKTRSTSRHCTCYRPSTRGDTASARDCTSSPGTFRNDNLKMLRKMKRLQTTLQRDDLSWT